MSPKMMSSIFRPLRFSDPSRSGTHPGSGVPGPWIPGVPHKNDPFLGPFFGPFLRVFLGQPLQNRGQKWVKIGVFWAIWDPQISCISTAKSGFGPYFDPFLGVISEPVLDRSWAKNHPKIVTFGARTCSKRGQKRGHFWGHF